MIFVTFLASGKEVLFIASGKEVIQIIGVVTLLKQISKLERVLFSQVSKLQTSVLVNLATSAVSERAF